MAYTREALSSDLSGLQQAGWQLHGHRRWVPPPCVVFIFLFPADKGPGHPEYRDAREIAQSAAQLEAPLIVPVTLISGRSPNGKECWVSRSFMFGKVWNDVYGLRVGSTLFRVGVQYNNEPARIPSYSDAIIAILSSVSVRIETASPK